MHFEIICLKLLGWHLALDPCSEQSLSSLRVSDAQPLSREAPPLPFGRSGRTAQNPEPCLFHHPLIENLSQHQQAIEIFCLVELFPSWSPKQLQHAAGISNVGNIPRCAAWVGNSLTKLKQGPLQEPPRSE